MTARCIATPGSKRCRHAAAPRDGLYMCPAHSLPVAFLNLFNTERTRRMLAYAEWETYEEGQVLVRAYSRLDRTA